MRLDKFLQVSRLVKRRALANALCDGGKVQRNGRAARASAEVAAGDVIRIAYGWRTVEVRIAEVPAAAVGKAQAQQLYTLVSVERDGQEPLQAD